MWKFVFMVFQKRKSACRKPGFWLKNGKMVRFLSETRQKLVVSTIPAKNRTKKNGLERHNKHMGIHSATNPQEFIAYFMDFRTRNQFQAKILMNRIDYRATNSNPVHWASTQPRPYSVVCRKNGR